MEKREFGRKSTRTVPVIIENHENAAKKTKLMVPSNYTAGHLINILRSRMHLLPYHPVYLFLKSKQSPVLMSKSIGHLHHKHRDEKGLLRLIHAGQASFGFRGNIRAIRFRQKWIENLHNTSHHGAGGPQSHSGAPPPYFPLEASSTSNFEALLDVDDLNDSIEDMPTFDEFYHSMLDGTSYSEVDEEIFPVSDMSNSMQFSNITPPQSSTYTNFSQSSSVTNSSTSALDWADPWLSSSLADPWQPSISTNSAQSSSVANALFANHEDEIDSFCYEMDLAVQNLNAVSASLSVPAIPDSSANAHPTNVSNPLVPPHSMILYESDSDFYDSDNDE